MIESDSSEIGLADSAAFSESLIELEVAKVDEGTTPRPAHEKTKTGDTEDHVEKWIGKKLGQFKLIRMLGQGGMGIVVQAMDTNLDRIVALKVLRKQIKGMDDQRSVKQFLREARAAAKLDHPNAAQIYEINEHQGWWYIATEMIEGGTLDQIVKATGRLQPVSACPIIADAASLLAVAHKLNIIHRDIKPHNLMLTRDGRCKVVDFGLVRWEDPNDPFDFTRRAVGTPHYLPPEASPGREPTPAYDIYSLGATLYYALTGKLPFNGSNLKEIIDQHRNAPRPDPRVYNPACSERLAELVKRCMAIDPEQRPTASDMAAVLRLENVGQPTDPAALVIDPSAMQPASDKPSGLTGFTGALAGSNQRTKLISSSGSTRALTRALTPMWVWVTRIAAVSVFIGAMAGFGKWALDRYQGAKHVRSVDAFEARFPEAPEAYGTLSDGKPAASSAAPTAPAFGWKGQADPGENGYVANRFGRRAYPVDHPLAVLIPADAAEFFPDAEAARAAGKQPTTVNE